MDNRDDDNRIAVHAVNGAIRQAGNQELARLCNEANAPQQRKMLQVLQALQDARYDSAGR